MADEKKPGAAAVFLSKHGEKLALGLSGAALLAYLLLGVLMAGKDRDSDALKAQIDAVTASTTKEHDQADMKAPAVKDYISPVRSTWDEVKTAKSADNWSASVATKFEGKPIKGPAEVIRVFKVPAIAWGGAEATLEGVKLAWSVTAFTPAEERAAGKNTDFLKITGLTLERRVNEQEKWEVLADALPPSTTSYVDMKIDPKTRYSYRVTSAVEKHAKHPDAKGMTVGTAAPVVTQSIWKVSFSQAMKGQAYVTIEKFEKNAGSKVEIKHMHHVGEKIGWWPDRGSADPVSKHFVPLPKGKTLEVDFNTGMELKSIEPVTLEVSVKKCKGKFTTDGKKLGCDTVVEKRNFGTSEIVYTDDEGEKKVHVPSPNLVDQMCEEHGPKKLEVKLPGATEKTPEQAKEEAAEAAKLKKEKEAETLFKQAEKDEAGNRANAVKLYNRLLKEYGGTDFVSKQKKALIEDRLGRLSQ